MPARIGFATNCVGDSPELTLLTEGYQTGITSLFNVLAEAFWKQKKASMENFNESLGNKNGSPHAS